MISDLYVWKYHGFVTPDQKYALQLPFCVKLLKTHLMQVQQNWWKIIHHLKQTFKLGLQFPHLDLYSLRLVMYSDASQNSTPEHKSQLGYIILLVNKHNTVDAEQLNCHLTSPVALLDLAFLEKRLLFQTLMVNYMVWKTISNALQTNRCLCRRWRIQNTLFRWKWKLQYVRSNNYGWHGSGTKTIQSKYYE